MVLNEILAQKLFRKSSLPMHEHQSVGVKSLKVTKIKDISKKKTVFFLALKIRKKLS